MEFVVFLVVLALEGLVVGAFARLALPGKDPMTIAQTIAVGLAGSLLAGVVVYLATDGRRGPGFIAALVFSTVIVYVVRRRRGGGLTKPSASSERSTPLGGPHL